MGARFDAWRQPAADAPFLERCASPVLYSDELDDAALKMESALMPIREVMPELLIEDDTFDLPSLHPLQEVHDVLPAVFGPLQFMQVAGSALVSRRLMLRSSSASAAARRLAAVSAMTMDPWWKERIFSRPREVKRAKDKRIRGRLTSYRQALFRDLHWQRD